MAFLVSPGGSTAGTNIFTHRHALHPDGGFRFDGGRGVDTLKVVLTAGEWASAAVQKEFASFATFLANAPRNALGEATGTFTFKTLNIQAVNIEKLQLVVAGKVVNPLNDAPKLNRPIADKAIDEDSGAFTYKLPANTFTDVDNAVLKYSAKLADGSALPAWLNFNAATKTFSGTPPQDFNGAFNIRVTASDGKLKASDVFKLTVTPLNDVPVANTDTATVDEDGSIVINVSANDTDADGAPDLDLNSLVIVGRPSRGSVTVNTDGTISYDHDGSETLTDSFSYTVQDATGTVSNVATVNVTVNPVNDAPTAVNNSYSLSEDGLVAAGGIGVRDNDTDPENDGLTAHLVTDVANGTLIFNSDGSFNYRPRADFNGTDSFTYKLNDGTSDSNVATVTFTVNPINDAPVVEPNETNVSPRGTRLLAYSGESLVQTFTAEGVNPLALFFHEVLDPCTIEVREWVGGALGNVLKSGLLPGAGSVSFDLSDVTFVEGREYAFVLGDTALFNASESDYSGGSFFYVRSGVLEPSPDGLTDLAFKLTYRDEATIDVDTNDSHQLKLSDLPFDDIDSDDSEISFSVVNAPDHGQFEKRSGGTTTVVTEFTHGDVAAGLIFYSHSGTAADDDSFSLRVSDESKDSVDTIDVVVNVEDDTDGFLNDTFQYHLEINQSVGARQTVTGGAGSEGLINPFTVLTIDFSDDQITIANLPGLASSLLSPGTSVRISDAFDQLRSFTAVTVAGSNAVGNPPVDADITVTGDLIVINFTGPTLFSAGGSLTLDVVFA